jgi:hypothetical protein
VSEDEGTRGVVTLEASGALLGRDGAAGGAERRKVVCESSS